MKPLHWSAPWLFGAGCAGAVFAASATWPNLMPWGIAFWFGWLMATFNHWQERMTKLKD